MDLPTPPRKVVNLAYELRALITPCIRLDKLECEEIG